MYLPKARSIFLLKCSLRSLIESTSFSSRNVLLLLNALRFSSLSFSSWTILSILSSEIFGAYSGGKITHKISIDVHKFKRKNREDKWCFDSIPFHTEDLKRRDRILDQLLSFYCILLHQLQCSWSSFCMHCIMSFD